MEDGRATYHIISENYPVLSYFNGLFLQDPHIDEYGLIFGDEESNLELQDNFVLVDHKLGISMKQLKPLFLEARQAFFNFRKYFNKQCQEGERFDTAEQLQLVTSLLQSSRALLMMNPDQYTAWNSRKELIVRGCVQVEEELRFLDLVFSKHAKKPSSWAHRTWCMRFLLDCQAKRKSNSPENEDAINTETESAFQAELSTCSHVADRYPRNYYAWVHRARALPHLTSHQVKAELTFTSDWMRRHISDYSCLNYRCLALERWLLCNENKNVPSKLSYLEADFKWIAELIERYPGHQSLWYYRGGLLVHWFDTLTTGDEESKNLGETQAVLPRSNWMHLLQLLEATFYALIKDDNKHGCNSPSENLESKEPEAEQRSPQNRQDLIELVGEDPVYLLVQEELGLVARCALDCSVWNYEKHHKHACSYRAFLAITLQRWLMMESKRILERNDPYGMCQVALNNLLTILNDIHSFIYQKISTTTLTLDPDHRNVIAYFVRS